MYFYFSILKKEVHYTISYCQFAFLHGIPDKKGLNNSFVTIKNVITNSKEHSHS